MDLLLQSSDQPVDLTEYITRTSDYPTALGGFGDIWRCKLQVGSNQIVVRIPAPTIIIFSGLSRLQSKQSGFKMEGSMKKYALQCYDDYYLCSHGCATQALRRELGTWKRLQHANILLLLGIARGFCPCISMVSPWFENGSLTLYLRKYDGITLFDRLRLVSFCMIRQWLH